MHPGVNPVGELLPLGHLISEPENRKTTNKKSKELVFINKKLTKTTIFKSMVQSYGVTIG